MFVVHAHAHTVRLNLGRLTLSRSLHIIQMVVAHCWHMTHFPLSFFLLVSMNQIRFARFSAPLPQYGYFQRKKTQHITTTTKKFHVVCICLFLSSVTNIVVRCLALVSAVNEFILILVVRVSRTRHCFFYSSEMI